MISYHDVVVAAVGLYRKTPHVISADISDGLDSDMELLGLGVRGLPGGQGGLVFGGPYPLASLG